MTPKSRPQGSSSTEEQWLALMKQRLVRIALHTRESQRLVGEWSRLDDLVKKHQFESDRLRSDIVKGGPDHPQLLERLKELRIHVRWAEHWMAQLSQAVDGGKRASEVIDMLTRQLGEVSYPGERPLVESTLEAKKDELDTRDPAGTNPELVRAEPA